jgi:hypothetical protein
LAAVTAPAAAFLVGTYVTADDSSQLSAGPPETHFSDAASVLGAIFEYNVAYSPFELVPRIVVFAGLAFFALRSIRTHPPHRSGIEAALGRAVLALLILYCVMPGTLRGWVYCSTRFFLFASVLLPVAAEVPPRLARHILAIGPALTCAVLTLQWPTIHSASRQMKDILGAGGSLPRGSKVIPIDFNVSVIGPQPTGAAWAELVVERNAVASQLFAAGKPRMGGERFRTVSFRAGVLDVATGELPWSTFEMWNDVGRKCADPRSPVHWFVHVDGDCQDLLAARKKAIEAVIDRYDYVLMLAPPAYGRELFASRLELVSQVGDAWLYAIVHSAAVRAPYLPN